ncbi:hypothetical protein [Clostridium frigoriphilum]|uniref:Uncharacterized protein n=2 Tax=Clostridium TaxID=1485 RepID=A0ABU7UR99_9CLOT
MKLITHLVAHLKPIKGLPSNRIRSKEQEIINKEEVEEVMIKQVILITKCENEIKYKNNSADTFVIFFLLIYSIYMKSTQYINILNIPYVVDFLVYLN